MAEPKLRPIRMTDAETCFRWVSDPEVIRYLGLLQPPSSVAGERSWIAGVLGDKAQQRVFVIEDEAGRPIGTCGLRGIDAQTGTAFLGIMIAEKWLWDRGYGTAATRKLLEYAFCDLGLREVRLSCHWENRRGLRCYQKAGFRESKEPFTPRRYGRQEVQMAISREQWEALARAGESEGELSAGPADPVPD